MESDLGPGEQHPGDDECFPLIMNNTKLKAEECQWAWPAVSFARMRAGLRSALKTECSGFLYQTGGRSLRWIRAERERLQLQEAAEHGGDTGARPKRWTVPVHVMAEMFWCGHTGLLALEDMAEMLVMLSGPTVWSCGDLWELSSSGRSLDGPSFLRTAEWALNTTVFADGSNALRDWFLAICVDQRKGFLQVEPGFVLALASVLEMQIDASRGDHHAVEAARSVAFVSNLVEALRAAAQAGAYDCETLLTATLMRAAACTGSLDIVKRYFTDDALQRIAAMSDFEVRRFHGSLATALGHGGSQAVCQWVADSYPPAGLEAIFRLHRSDLLCGASFKGHLEFIRSAFSAEGIFNIGGRGTSGTTNAGAAFTSPIMMEAAIAGDTPEGLTVLRWLRALSVPCPFTCLSLAIGHGQHETFQYLHDDVGLRLGRNADRLLKQLVMHSPPGTLQTLEVWSDRRSLPPIDVSALVGAALSANVRVDVLHFLCSHLRFRDDARDVWEDVLQDASLQRDLHARDALLAVWAAGRRQDPS